MASTVGTAETRDGLALQTRHWEAAGNPWVMLLLVHGIAEHSGRYERTGSSLAAAGIDTHAFDLRGFGASAGRRAYVGSWDEYLDDVEVRLDALRNGLPLVLMGHSMGSLIALGYAASGRPAPDLLVLSSPPLRATVPAVIRGIAPLLSRIAPTRLMGNGLRPEQLSRDPAVGRAYFADPLVFPRSTARLGAEMFAAMRRAQRDAGRLRVPALVTHGADDTIVPVAASEPFASLPGVERRIYPGLRHETLNEPEGPQVVADIIAWLRRQTTPAETGALE
jgi:acylglycerol lipase